jgi:hypothetical protein
MSVMGIRGMLFQVHFPDRRLSYVDKGAVVACTESSNRFQRGGSACVARRDEKLTATFNQDLDSRILIRQVQVWWTEEFL